jgi:3'-phosphoadenosine 5'-phosphosulfate sulfotransferase
VGKTVQTLGGARSATLRKKKLRSLLRRALTAPITLLGRKTSMYLDMVEANPMVMMILIGSL